jgi:tRNA splicing endonuclease
LKRVRYRVGKRIAPNTAEMEQAWNDEKNVLVNEIRKIDGALSALKLQRLEMNRTFERNFMKAAKRILDEVTFNEIVEITRTME